MSQHIESKITKQMALLKRADWHGSAKQVYATIHPLATLVDQLGDKPEIQAALRVHLTELSAKATALLRMSEAINEEMVDVSLGLSGFIKLIDQAGEMDINSFHVRYLLSPLCRQLEHVENATNETFVG